MEERGSLDDPIAGGAQTKRDANANAVLPAEKERESNPADGLADTSGAMGEKKSGAVFRKACESCSRSKVRCSGERPCQRCKVKNRKCEYVLKHRSRKSPRRLRIATELEHSPLYTPLQHIRRHYQVGAVPTSKRNSDMLSFASLPTENDRCCWAVICKICELHYSSKHNSLGLLWCWVSKRLHELAIKIKTLPPRSVIHLRLWVLLFCVVNPQIAGIIKATLEATHMNEHVQLGCTPIHCRCLVDTAAILNRLGNGTFAEHRDRIPSSNSIPSTTTNGSSTSSSSSSSSPYGISSEHGYDEFDRDQHQEEANGNECADVGKRDHDCKTANLESENEQTEDMFLSSVLLAQTMQGSCWSKGNLEPMQDYIDAQWLPSHLDYPIQQPHERRNAILEIVSSPSNNSAGMLVRTNQAFEYLFHLSSEQLNHALLWSHGGLLPFGLDVVCLLLAEPSEVFTFLQLLEVQIKSLRGQTETKMISSFESYVWDNLEQVHIKTTLQWVSLHTSTNSSSSLNSKIIFHAPAEELHR